MINVKENLDLPEFQSRIILFSTLSEPDLYARIVECVYNHALYIYSHNKLSN